MTLDDLLFGSHLGLPVADEGVSRKVLSWLRFYKVRMGSIGDRLVARLARSLRWRLGIDEIAQGVDHLRGEVGRIQARQLNPASGPGDSEFAAFSQFEDDGVLQWLIRAAKVPDSFVEIGSSDYKESNTRFLAQVMGWRGLIIDGSARNIDIARRMWWFERRDVRAVASFVTAENVNALVEQYAPVPVGLLTLDLDGMDYWVWRAIKLAPPIVMIEYNARFGPEQSVTVPYDAAFVRGEANSSHVYFGASLEALHRLGRSKGYKLVACSSAGVNAFFVRSDVTELEGLDTRSAYRSHRHREHRDGRGNLTWIAPEEEAASIQGLPLVTVDATGEPSVEIA